MTKEVFENTFYLIAKYSLGQLEGFVKMGDDKEEIMKLFEEKYMWKTTGLGVTENSHQLLECNAKEIMSDREFLDKLKGK